MGTRGLAGKVMDCLHGADAAGMAGGGGGTDFILGRNKTAEGWSRPEPVDSASLPLIQWLEMYLS